MRTWLITGCSTGLGRAIAVEALARGEQVVVTARRVDAVADIAAAAPERALALPLDVTDTAQIGAAVAAGEARFGGIDILVNNAGYGYVSAIEEGDGKAVRAMFDVNFFGALATIQAVLPGMRQRGAGHIVNITSIAGRIANPATGFYSASKYALEGLSVALARELQPLHIKVTSVAPGMFRTDFSGRSLKAGGGDIAAYAAVHERMGLVHAVDGHQQGDPRKLAEAVLAVVDSPAPPVQLLMGSDAYKAVSGAMDACRAEMEAWKDLSCGSDFT